MQVSQTSLSTLVTPQDAELPVLQQLGFRRPETATSEEMRKRWPYSTGGTIGLTGSSEHRSPGLTPKSHRSRSNSATNSYHSNSSSTSDLKMRDSTTLPYQLKSNGASASAAPGPSTGPSMGGYSIADKLQADQLTSCLSRIKYLYDQSENSEAVPISIPAGSSYSDQRSLIKAQAQIIRNQLDLKYSSISFISQLGKFNEGSYMFDTSSGKYNPLQVIRDRKKRPPTARQPHRVNMWQIPVSEQIQDIRWRFRTARTKAHKRRKQRKGGSFSKEQEEKEKFLEGLSHSSETLAGSPEQGSPRILVETPNSSQHFSNSSTTAVESTKPPHFTNPFLASHTATYGGNGYVDAPTQSLPKSECTELISRLRSRHSVYIEDEKKNSWDSPGGHDGSGESSAGGSHKSVGGSEEYPVMDESSWARSRFCRNTASVADTWNRLYKARTNSTNSQAVDDNLLKPLARTTTANSSTSQSGASTASSALIDNDDLAMHPVHDEPPLPAGILKSSASSKSKFESETAVADHPGDAESLAQPLGTPSWLRSRTGSSTELPPILTVTTNDGKQKILDDSSRKNSVGFATSDSEGNSRPRSLRPRRKESYSSDVIDVHNDEIEDGGYVFGSLRSSANDMRKNAYERKLCDLESDLKFLIPFYKVALRREEPNAIRQRSQLKIEACISKAGDNIGDTLKKELITKFLTYLSKVEHNVVSEQLTLDADIAASLDGLRVTTDLIAGEVNTTLNRRLREVSSRMERLYNYRDCGYFAMMLYTVLEYSVLCCMWVIWCGVQFWKSLSLVLKVLKTICSHCIVA